MNFAEITLRDPELGHNWVHLCGADEIRKALDAMAWAWKTLRSRITRYNPELGGEL